jgi:hypothetical protein
VGPPIVPDIPPPGVLPTNEDPDIPSVPEPGTMTLLGSGLAALGLLRLRRKKSTGVRS